MPFLLIQHKLKDFDAWKRVFDEHGVIRRESGSQGGFLLRRAEDPDDVVILLEWDDLEKARRFTQSEDLRATMQRAGVVSQPTFWFLEEADRPAV